MPVARRLRKSLDTALRAHAKLALLLDSDRSGRVRKDDKHGCFMMYAPNGVYQPTMHRYQGVTRLISEIFFPDYKRLPDSWGRTTGGGSAHYLNGWERGKEVHEQIEHYINMSEKQFKEKHPTIHSFTEKLALFMRKHRLTPLYAEFVVYDEALKIASAIDALCTNEKDELVIVDWKTGMDTDFERPYGRVKNLLPYLPEGIREEMAPFVAQLDDCPKHKAFFQVLLYKSFLRELWGVNADRAIVVQVTQDDVLVHEIPPKIALLETAIYQAFREGLLLSREDREAQKKARKEDEGYKAKRREYSKMYRMKKKAEKEKAGAPKVSSKKKVSLSSSSDKTTTKKKKTKVEVLEKKKETERGGGKEEIDEDEILLFDLTLGRSV